MSETYDERLIIDPMQLLVRIDDPDYVQHLREIEERVRRWNEQQQLLRRSRMAGSNQRPELLGQVDSAAEALESSEDRE